MDISKLKHTVGANVVKGDVKPLKGRVLVRDLDFSAKVTKGGIYIPGDDGDERGIHPRWAQVWKVGEGIDDIKEGEWVLLKHGRWSRTITIDNGNEVFRINMIDYPDAILLIGDHKTDDVYATATKSYT